MKTDKIFYTLFQVFPELLFQLIGESPENAQNYEFNSIEIKELAFRLDGLFLPDENYPDYPLYFVEVQCQKDEEFYWRFITEIFLYLNQYKPLRPFYAVVLWANHKLDEGIPLPYQQLLVNQWMQRIYLDQLNPQTPKSLGLNIIDFIIINESEATKQVPLLINQTKEEVNDPVFQEKVIELIEKIIVYKFPQKTRKELEAMFNLVEWKQTKFYQEAEQEGEVKGKLETVPLLLRLGLKPQQIAQELNLDLEIIRQYIASQNN
jgi:predicted transposase/invertase (TIGR01784 family)